jgi:hypothetical protein
MSPKIVKPHCEKCGSAECHPYQTEIGAYEWLCGSCRYLRQHPNAERKQKLPRERSVAKQRERLF